MMKLTILFLFVAGSSSAFTSLSRSSTASFALSAEKVPCFGAAPFPGDRSVFFGENYWDALTTEWGTEDTGTYVRAAYVHLYYNELVVSHQSGVHSELKHGRSAMVATVGFALQKLGITFDKFTPHEYLSVTQNVKFADLASMGPVEALKAIPAEGYAQVFLAIAAIEIYELTHRDGSIQTGQSVAPGLQTGGLTGDLGWNPLKIKVDDRRRLVELQNGRAAMYVHL